ncbi:MAG TPA: hypothetical protein VK463_03620 [Desulfomonilaceae bacterium]|nr:hypothetical protein [Desulfomonilaceae bacterium]
MPGAQRKTINARQAVKDIRSGMADPELMEKYELSAGKLQVLFTKLVDTGLLDRSEVQSRGGGIERRQIAWKCPACGAPQTRVYDECPACGVIVAKFGSRHADVQDRTDPHPGESHFPGQHGDGRVLPPAQPMSLAAGAAARAPIHEPEPLENMAEESDDDGPLEPRTLDKPEWTMLLVGSGVALVCLLFFWPRWILGTFRTLVHEIGHAIFGWAFGYPSLPAFDFLWGGGVTLHIGRSVALCVLVYVGFAALLYMFRKNTSTVVCLVLLAILHALLSYTRFHNVVILFMGHGTELVIGGLFIYRSLSGRAIIHPAERPLYAITGFFLVFSDIAMGFSLLTDADARADYLDAKGGDFDMDFVRIARDYLHVKMTSVVFFFFLCSLLAPVLSFLAFRYEEYIHSTIAFLWRREPQSATASVQAV